MEASVVGGLSIRLYRGVFASATRRLYSLRRRASAGRVLPAMLTEVGRWCGPPGCRTASWSLRRAVQQRRSRPRLPYEVHRLHRRHQPHGHAYQPNVPSAAALHAPAPNPCVAVPGAKDRATEERRAGLHERSQGGRLASACENRYSSRRRHRGAIPTQGVNSTPPSAAAP